jgi:hypothetical protein
VEPLAMDAEGLLAVVLEVPEWVEGLQMTRKMEEYKLATNVEDQITLLETAMQKVWNVMLVENLKDIL